MFLAIFVAAPLQLVQAQAITPAEVQQKINQGRPDLALQQLAPIFAHDPRSATAWYLKAEALDAIGQPAAARISLQTAEQLSPDMPFAKPKQLHELEARLHVTSPSTKALRTGLLVVAALALTLALFVAALLMRNRRRRRAQLRRHAEDLLVLMRDAIATLEGLRAEAELKGTARGMSPADIDQRCQEGAQAVLRLQAGMAKSSLSDLRLATEQAAASLHEWAEGAASRSTPSQADGVSAATDHAPHLDDMWKRRPVAPVRDGQTETQSRDESQAPRNAPYAAPVVVNQQSDSMGTMLGTALLVDMLQGPRTETTVIVDQDTGRDSIESSRSSSDGGFADSSLSATDSSSSSWSSDSDSGLADTSSSDSSWDSGADSGVSSDDSSW